MRLLPTLLLLNALLLPPGTARAAGDTAAEPAPARPWEEVVAEARGQTVYWAAWAGDSRTNAFLRWVAGEVRERYGIRLEHWKLSDTGEAVARIAAEKAAGRDEDGSIDLLWVNGPNFLALKEADLLYGPFLGSLPHSRYLDRSPGSPAVTDFTVPTEGYESPWRLARLVLLYDRDRVPDPPANTDELLAWAREHPGRLTHPDPANFMGATFLKQALLEQVTDPAALAAPATPERFAEVTAPLWEWYDALRPHLWRQGRSFPADEFAQRQLLADGAVDFGLSFDPASAAAAVREGLLPESVRTLSFEGGMIGNFSFVAIPYNSGATAAARVVANFLLAPATQARAEDIRVLGSFSVLERDRLSAGERALFDALPSPPGLPTPEELGPVRPEPHPSWMTRLTRVWKERYTR